MKHKLIVLSLILLSINCHAEKWVHVDNDFYIDTDSKKSNGDLTDILIKTSSTPSGWITFDCKRKIFFTDKGAVEITKNSFQEKVLIAVCKKPWEVWK